MAKLVDGPPGAMKQLPQPMPKDVGELLELADDAANYAAPGQGVTAPRFDHGMRLFSAAHAHAEVAMTRQLEKAHKDLTEATKGLKIATWVLVIATIILLVAELLRLV